MIITGPARIAANSAAAPPPLLKSHGISRPLRVYCPQGGVLHSRAGPKVRCVFRRDSGSLTFDVPPSETSRWRAVARVLRSPMDALSCALLPAFCTLCGSPLPQLSSVPICDVCWTEFPVQSGPVCARCGDTLAAPCRRRTERHCALPGLPAGPAALCAGGGFRALPGPHESGHPRAQVRPAASGGPRAGPDAGRRPLPNWRPKRRLKCWWFPCRCTAQSMPSAASTRPVRWLLHALESFCARRHPEWRLTLASSTLMRLRATESQAGLTPRQRRLNVRGAFTVSDPAAVSSQAHSAHRRHLHHRRNGARRRPGAAARRSGLGVGGHAGQGAPHYESAVAILSR